MLVPDLRWRLRLRYYAAMLSVAVFAAALGAAAALMTDRLEMLPHLLSEIATWLVVVNAAGALLILRPVDRWIELRDRGIVTVRGFYEPLRVYEPAAHAEEAPARAAG